MIPSRTMLRAASRSIEDARARLALGRVSRLGRDVRVLGRPNVVADGTIVIGNGVVIVSTPAAVTLVSERGATIEVGDGASIESGVTIRARRRVRIEPGARIEAGAVIDDLTSVEPELLVSARAERGKRSERARASDRIREVIASVVAKAAELGPSEDIRALPGWDSLAALRVIVALEKQLGLQLPHDLFSQPRTLETIEAVAAGEAAP